MFNILNKRSAEPGGEPDRVQELEEKVAELEQAMRIMREDLIHDSLTGLKTRKFFEEEARIYFDAVSKREQSTRKEWFGFKHLSFVMFDIDHFKSVNDTHGHQVGDSVLQAVAHVIDEAVREGDIAARWGGEEMIVALPGADEREAQAKADTIRKHIERMAFNNLPNVKVSISGGVASVEPGTAFEEVIKRADDALYKAKETGRNRIMSYTELIDFE